jgi:beta-galactosidase
VAGTFVWSGFDYLGEARGWPQNTKCRGTVADVAGFPKETAYWLRSVWLSNISDSDAGRPLLSSLPTNLAGGSADTTFIVESWAPLPADSAAVNRTIHVYSNSPRVQLMLNGEVVGTAAVPFFDAMATFSVAYAAGNLTAISLDATGAAVSSHSIVSTGAVAGIVLTIDAPSIATGTGSMVVADGEDVAMIRATLVDKDGHMVPSADNNITFSVASGPGVVWTTHNGGPANLSPNDATWNQAYHGLARAIIRTTADHATAPAHRRRMREIDVEGGVNMRVIDPDAAKPVPLAPIVVRAVVSGTSMAAEVSVPTTTDLSHLPLAVAQQVWRPRSAR